MNRTAGPLLGSGLLVLGLISSTGPSGASAEPGARPVGVPAIVLLASGHAGKVTADLGEQVRFEAIAPVRLAKGDFIEIVNIETHELLDLCNANPCVAADQLDKPATYSYRAYITHGLTQVLGTGPSVRVQWKNLTMQVKVTDPARVIKLLKAQPDTVLGMKLYYEQLKGVSVYVAPTFPSGFSTAWTSVQIFEYSNAPTRTQTCTLGQACRMTVPAPDTTYDTSVEIDVDVLGKSQALERTARVYIHYRDWKVTMTATNNGTGAKSPSSLSLKPSETGTVDAAVAEPNTGKLVQFLNRIELRTRAPNSPATDRGTLLLSCKHTLTCKADLDGATVSDASLWAEVVGSSVDARGTPLLQGRGNDVAVRKAQETSTSCSASVSLSADAQPAFRFDPVNVTMNISPDLTGAPCTVKLYEKNNQGPVLNTCQSTCVTHFPYNEDVSYSGPCQGAGTCVLKAYVLRTDTNPETFVGESGTLNITWP